MRKNVSKELLNFSEFLNGSWNLLMKSVSNRNMDKEDQGKIVEIFIQANWEIMVEMTICDNDEILDYYGGGADLFDLSSRIIAPEKESNSRIIVISENAILDEFSKEKYELNDWTFFSFVSLKDDIIYLSPPFDYAIVENLAGKQFLFKKELLEFFHVLNK